MKNNPWILIRGLGRGRGHWGDFPDIFQQRSGVEKLQYIDIPGNGDLYNKKTPLLASECIHSFQQQAKEFGSGPFHIIAISLGAMAALEWLKISPQDIASLHLINTSSIELSGVTQRLIPSSWHQIFFSMLNTSSLSREKRILRLTTNSPTTLTQYAQKNSDYSQSHPVTIDNFVRQLWLAQKFSLPNQLVAPTQFFVSDQDRMVSSDCSLQIAKKYNCELIHHPWAGHDLTLDDPEWLTTQILSKHQQKN